MAEENRRPAHEVALEYLKKALNNKALSSDAYNIGMMSGVFYVLDKMEIPKNHVKEVVAELRKFGHDSCGMLADRIEKYYQ